MKKPITKREFKETALNLVKKSRILIVRNWCHDCLKRELLRSVAPYFFPVDISVDCPAMSFFQTFLFCFLSGHNFFSLFLLRSKAFLNWSGNHLEIGEDLIRVAVHFDTPESLLDFS